MSMRVFGRQVGISPFTPLVGDSMAMRELRRQVTRAARTSLSVLIEGPSGSGKELVAQGLHVESGRPGRFVAFNVCAVADGMFEDALFGHLRGAYSGAIADSAGYCEEASGGSLFLDEIGALGLAQQAKLLRVVETKTFRKVGGRADQHSDFRLITASNRSLERLSDASLFRDDLRHRLAGVVIRVPALAEHREDIPALVSHFAAHAAVPDHGAVVFSSKALDHLRSRAWPGNIRELKCVVERAIAFSTTPRIGYTDVHPMLESTRSGYFAEQGTEHRRVFDAMAASDWDTIRAANLLGMNRSSLYRVLKRLGMTRRALMLEEFRTSCLAERDDERAENLMRILPHSP